MNIFLLTLTIMAFISCGKSAEKSEDEQIVEEHSPDGTYSAILIPVNHRLSNQIHGEARVIKYADEFKVNVRIRGAPSGNFRQHLQTGSICPKLEHDLNGDGYIDAHESRTSSGAVVVPLDGDLSSQESGGAYVLRGNYHYTRSTSYYLMMSDLHLPDEVINDALIKIPDRDLPLERRVVMVYALNPGVPDTVSGDDIPVACGVLTRIGSGPTSGDEWQDEPDEEPERPRRRRPRPRPRPEPDPTPNPDDQEENQNGGWWSRWRDRWRDWWYGSGANG